MNTNTPEGEPQFEENPQEGGEVSEGSSSDSNMDALENKQAYEWEKVRKEAGGELDAAEDPRKKWERERDEGYADYQEKKAELEEFKASLPDDADALFAKRDEIQKEMDATSGAYQDRAKWTELSNKAHAINDKLNELGIEGRD